LEPSVLLLDDPFELLDGPARTLLCEQLETIVPTTGLAMLVATSDARVAARLGDDVIVISGGTGTTLDGAAAGARPRSDEASASLSVEVERRLVAGLS
jgi:ABC-type nitrate/sulfonate/bicarbonate transport system ATPase subunit